MRKAEEPPAYAPTLVAVLVYRLARGRLLPAAEVAALMGMPCEELGPLRKRLARVIPLPAAESDVWRLQDEDEAP